MNKTAVTALVVSIAGYVIGALLIYVPSLTQDLGDVGQVIIVPALVPIIALALGIVSLRQISHSGKRGRSMAWAAIALSLVFLLGIVLVVLLLIAAAKAGL
jgi:hypothetical protein